MRSLDALPLARLAPEHLPFELPSPADAVPGGPGWLFELKWDGVRVLAIRRAGRVELWSRSGRPLGRRYPEVAAGVAALDGGDLALDAEVVALDDEGRPSFERLQRRMHVAREVARAASAVPVTAYVHDCLALLGRDVRGLPLVARKALVRELIRAPGALRYTDHIAADGDAFLAVVRARGLEGVVAKRADAPYRGGRGSDWLKIKCHRRQEFVIGGYTDPQGTRACLGAVHLGVHDRGGLVYAGRAGSGFDDDLLLELHARLRALATTRCPFALGSVPRGPEHHWIRPELVCEVRFTEWTADGLVRHPVFLGLRDDKDRRAVRREPTPR